MNKPDTARLYQSELEQAESRWQQEFDSTAKPTQSANRSSIEIKPLYTPRDRDGEDFFGDIGFPGEYPNTRGIYASMHRGRSWTQRQLIGWGTPEDYNARLKDILAHGATALSLIPCNSVYRGYDADEVPQELLGTCGAVINSVEDMSIALADVPIDRLSCAMNDPSPFTLFALLLAVAKRRGISWNTITGTSNQSDYLSHAAANHMFFRLSLPGARRVLIDHIQFANESVPGWNPLSVVGQHTQQAGATPAESMAFTLSAALQYGEDCLARGMDPDRFLPRFTFFFDISISFFEEIAKFRAGRRIWAKIAREKLGAKDSKSWRFKFHGQTSGVDLTRQQPLNNIARVTAQAMAGIFGGLQSLHTDGYDEAVSVPTAEAARVAVATQSILREEAHLTDVIDPLGGSYYVETLTDQMQQQIEAVMKRIEDAGGMYKAVESGLVQQMIGESAFAHQQKIENGEQTVVGVNAYCIEEDASEYRSQPYPDPASVSAHCARLKAFKQNRSQAAAQAALDALARAAQGTDNVMAAIVSAVDAGATHGEVCATLRRELGFGQPLAIV
ncbi:MAG: methylmalonyl-CoA mutase family protein [Burkholderiaceae bacterium]